MYSDQNYFIYCIFLASMILLSMKLLNSCLFTGLGKFCNVLIIVLYPMVFYTIIKSTEESKNSKYKNTRYIINSLFAVIIVLMWLVNIRNLLLKDNRNNRN